jgi:hypothetical protein
MRVAEQKMFSFYINLLQYSFAYDGMEVQFSFTKDPDEEDPRQR